MFELVANICKGPVGAYKNMCNNPCTDTLAFTVADTITKPGTDPLAFSHAVPVSYINT